MLTMNRNLSLGIAVLGSLFSLAAFGAENGGHGARCRLALLGCEGRTLASIEAEAPNTALLAQTDTSHFKAAPLPTADGPSRRPSTNLYTAGFALDNTFRGTPARNDGWQIPLPAFLQAFKR